MRPLRPFPRGVGGCGIAACVLAFAFVLGTAVHAASPDERASALGESAERWLRERTIESRRMAIRDLEHALDIAPDRVDLQLLLARAYEQAGFERQSRLRFERALALAPRDPAARFGLALAWRRDWLKFQERVSLERATEHLEAVTTLVPGWVEAWIQLSVLRLELGRTRPALAAAEQALAVGRASPESQLATASARWRIGDVRGADSLFRVALGRVRRSVRTMYDDIAPLATERDTALLNRLPTAERAEFERRFWRDLDPDLVTPENEARLEYWARVTQAYFLWYDARRRVWDERGEVYVRYGPPDSVAYNPIGTSMYSTAPRGVAGSRVQFPLNVLVWEYRALGMTVTMHDRMLSGAYELPVSLDEDLDPRPDPDSVAASGLLAGRESRALFPMLPPGARGLDLRTGTARFEGADGRTRLFAAVSFPGTPADRWAADFVVLDSAFTEIVRERVESSASACDAGGRRVATFDRALPPGRYLVGASVSGEGRRGLAREAVELTAPDGTLSVSDLVLTCGTPLAGEGAVRLDADPAGIVSEGEPLVAYFEAYHLEPGADGLGRFEYETAVRSADRDGRIWIQRLLSPRREGAELGITRQDAVLGTVRRQYVSVPVQGLPAGRYRLEVTVRDVVGGGEVRRSVGFVRE